MTGQQPWSHLATAAYDSFGVFRRHHSCWRIDLLSPTYKPEYIMKIDRSTMTPQGEFRMSAVCVPDAYHAERAPPERLTKGQDVRLQDNVQRMVGALATLLPEGGVEQARAAAAERWYRDYVMGVVGARDPEVRPSGRAPDIHAAMLARAAAIGRCRAVREGLGLCSELRLKLLLVDELSFSAIAAMLLPGDTNGRRKIAAQMSFLLEQLAEQYGSIDRRRLVQNVPVK